MNLSSFNFPTVSIPAIILVTITSLVLVLVQRWRWMVVALATQYIGVFVLSAFSWPLELASVKLIVGWMVSAVLGVGMIFGGKTWKEEAFNRSSAQILRLLFALLVGLVIYSSVPALQSWLPISGIEAITGGMILIGMGALHLGFSSHPFRVIASLLTIFSGFEIIYAGLEVSSLVAGLLAAIDLGIAFVGAYLLIMPIMELSE
jgi:hypothetical protein